MSRNNRSPAGHPAIIRAASRWSVLKPAGEEKVASKRKKTVREGGAASGDVCAVCAGVLPVGIT